MMFRLLKKTNKKKFIYCAVILALLPALAMAEQDPFSKSASQMSTILFGPLGTTLCSIVLGATFVMAKVGKISWDKFLYIGFCTVGFLGSPKIVALFKGWL